MAYFLLPGFPHLPDQFPFGATNLLKAAFTCSWGNQWNCTKCHLLWNLKYVLPRVLLLAIPSVTLYLVWHLEDTSFVLVFKRKQLTHSVAHIFPWNYTNQNGMAINEESFLEFLYFFVKHTQTQTQTKLPHNFPRGVDSHFK